jgi:hypothetical protein
MQSYLTKDRGSPPHDLWRLRCEPLLHLTSGLSVVGSFVLTASAVSARMAPKGSLREKSAAPKRLLTVFSMQFHYGLSARSVAFQPYLHLDECAVDTTLLAVWCRDDSGREAPADPGESCSNRRQSVAGANYSCLRKQERS